MRPKCQDKCTCAVNDTFCHRMDLRQNGKCPLGLDACKVQVCELCAGQLTKRQNCHAWPDVITSLQLTQWKSLFILQAGPEAAKTSQHFSTPLALEATLPVQGHSQQCGSEHHGCHCTGVKSTSITLHSQTDNHVTKVSQESFQQAAQTLVHLTPSACKGHTGGSIN